MARFLRRLASFSRLIVFDKRGTGLSDRVAHLPTLEERMDDVRAVMEAAGSERAALFGISEGGPMSILFAATYPERTSALALYGAMARSVATEDYPWAPTQEVVDEAPEGILYYWGQGVSCEVFAPTAAEDPRFLEWWARFERLGASPGAMVTMLRMFAEIDVRHVLLVFQDGGRAWPGWSELLERPDEATAHPAWNVARVERWPSADGFETVSTNGTRL